MASLLAALTAGVMIANVGGALWPAEAVPSAGGVSVSATPTPTFRSLPPVEPSPVSRPRVTPTDFHAGMTMVVYGNDSQLDAKATAVLDRLVGLGVNTRADLAVVEAACASVDHADTLAF